jgi:hypothetical protein
MAGCDFQYHLQIVSTGTQAGVGPLSAMVRRQQFVNQPEQAISASMIAMISRWRIVLFNAARWRRLFRCSLVASNFRSRSELSGTYRAL